MPNPAPNNPKPPLIHEALFQTFDAIAKDWLGQHGEADALLLIAPWVMGGYPPGVLVTREDKISPDLLLSVIKQCHAMIARLGTVHTILLKEQQEALTRRSHEARTVETGSAQTSQKDSPTNAKGETDGS